MIDSETISLIGILIVAGVFAGLSVWWFTR